MSDNVFWALLFLFCGELIGVAVGLEIGTSANSNDHQADHSCGCKAICATGQKCGMPACEREHGR